MKKNKIDFKLIKKEIFIITGAVFFVFCFYLIMYLPQVKKTAKMYTNLKEVEKNAEQYKDIDLYLNRLQKLRKRTVMLINDYAKYKEFNNRNEQSFFEEISRICRRLNVKPNKMNSINAQQGLNRKGWSISFGADYFKIIRLLSELENYFELKDINITSGKNKAMHTVDMNMYVIPFSSSSQKNEMLNILSLPDSADTLIKSIDKMEEYSNISFLNKRDPMLFLKPVKSIKIIPKKKEEPLPVLKLDGIIWDTQTPMAVVDGKLLKIGDKIKEAEIIEIQRQSVTFDHKSRKFTLNIKKENN